MYETISRWFCVFTQGLGRPSWSVLDRPADVIS